MFWRKKREEKISRVNPGFEETERRTPKAGIFLLIIMVIAGLYFGWQGLNDLSGLVSYPEQLSSCSAQYGGVFGARNYRYLSTFGGGYYGGGNYGYEYASGRGECQFSSLEKKYPQIQSLFEQRKPLAEELAAINQEKYATENSLYSVQTSIKRARGQYDVSLQERQARVPDPIYQAGLSGQSLAQLESQEQTLLAKKAELESRGAAINEKLRTVDEYLKAAYQPVFETQNRKMRWYEFWVFLVQALFVLPLFFLAFRWYLKLHRKNSPYTIIMTSILVVVGILLLRVLFVWFWGLFLARVLEVLLELLNFEIIRTVLFYLGMLLSFLIFGGAVYWLQKKIFDPRRVAIRRFRAKQCPHCQTSLDLAEMYCPNCGGEIRRKCSHCGQSRFTALPNCPHCGQLDMAAEETKVVPNANP